MSTQTHHSQDSNCQVLNHQIWTLAILLALVLVTSLSAAPVADSNAFNDRTELDLHVSPRTGMVSLTLPVLSLPGKGELALKLAYTFHQGGGSNRYEPIAPGWGVNLPYYDVVSERLTLGNGQSYQRRGGTLRYYRLKDVDFRAESGTAPDGQDYAFVLVHLSGHRDYFDRHGNIITSADRFGNFVSYRIATYEPQEGAAFFATITDTFGQVLSFEHDAEGRRILTLPNDHQVTLEHIPNVDRLIITNPLGDQIWVDGHVEDAKAAGTGAAGTGAAGTGAPGAIAAVHYPTGLEIRLEYQDLINAAGPPLRVVRSVDKIDTASGERLEAIALYDFDPEGNDGRNFLGPCTDRDRDCLMEDSDNQGYAYQSRVDRGEVSILNHFDRFHRQRERRVLGVDSAGEPTLLRTTTYDYPGEVTTPWDQVPANFQRPHLVATDFFDPDGNCRSVEHAVVHDDYGRKTSETRADGTVATWSYDDPTGALGEGAYGLVLEHTVTTADGEAIRHTSTPTEDHRTLAQTILSGASSNSGDEATDPLATVTRFTYYDDGRIASRARSWVDPPQGQPFLSTVEKMRYGTMVWDGRAARSLTRTDPVGHEWLTVVDAATGRRLAQVNPLGHTETTSWDALGRPTQIVRVDGTSTTTEYSLAPNQKTDRHSNGLVERWTFDALGHPFELADNNDHARGMLLPEPSLLRKRLAYDDLGRKAGVTTFEPGSEEVADFVALCYDPLDRPTITAQGVPCDQLDDGSSFGSVLSYDDVANTVASRRIVPSDLMVTGDAGYSTTVTKDSLVRVLRADLEPLVTSTEGVLGKAPEGRTRSFDYDGFGRLHLTENPAMSHRVDHTPQGWRWRETLTDPEPTNGATLSREHRHDLLGNRLQTTVSQTIEGHLEKYHGALHTYDPAGRLSAIESPSGHKTELRYHADGSLASQTNRDGTVLYFDYDEAGRRTDQCFAPPDLTGTDICRRPGASAHLRWTYIDDDPQLLGLLRSVEWVGPSPGTGTAREAGTVPGAVRYGYYPNGRRRSITYPDPAGGPSRTMNFTYDAWANSDTVTDFFGVTTTYSYLDQGGQRLLAEARSSNGSAVVYGYYPSHLLRSITRSQNEQPVAVTTLAYNAFGEIASLETFDLTHLLLHSERYAYDADGRVVDVESASDFLISGSGPLGARHYAYQLNRLASEEDTRGDASAGVTDFAFDAAGNLTRRGNQTQHYDVDNQLTAIDDPDGGRSVAAFVWNEDGNLLQDHRGNQYSFNRLNQLVGFTRNRPKGDRQSVTYSYYADGRRATRGVDGVVQRFFYDGRGEVANSTVDGRRFSDYLVGHGREGRTLDDTTTFYLHDRHGSVSALLPAAGEPEFYAYDAWGSQIVRPAAADEEDLLADNPFRYTGAYLDTATGLYHLKARDYSPRLASFVTRDSADLLNRTAYADGNPVMKVDPSGHFAWYDVVAPLVGAVVTVATGGLGAPLVDGSLVLGALLAGSSGVVGSAASDGIIVAGHGKVDWGASLAAGAVGGFLGAGTGGAVGQGLERAGASFLKRAAIGGALGGVAGAVGAVGTSAAITGTPLASSSNLISIGVGAFAGAVGGTIDGSWVPEADAATPLDLHEHYDMPSDRWFFDLNPSEGWLRWHLNSNAQFNDADQNYNVVIGHGGSRYFYADVQTGEGEVQLRRISAQRLAEELTARVGADELRARPIRLSSCFTARLTSGIYSSLRRFSTAQKLAHAINNEIRAATMSLNVGALRTEDPAQEFTGLSGYGGRWVTITPRN